MKRLLKLILPLFLCLLLASQAYAEGIYTMVGSGAVTQPNMKISGVNGTAFIDFSDSEAAANKLINHKGYLLKVRDSSKRAIQGYVKAAGTGETFGAEQVTGNSSTFATIGLWNIGGGSTVTGNYDSGDVDHSTTLRIESGDTSYESATFNASFFTGGVPAAGVLLRTDLDYKWISKTQTTTFEYTYGATLSFTAPAGSWNSTIGYYTCKASEGRMDAYVVFNAGVATDELLLDNFLVKRVTDCAATGALIVSAKDGATRAWAYMHASFNPILASTYKIFYVGD
jgi:hypothetical protein